MLSARFTKIPCVLVFSIHDVDIKQHISGKFDIHWSRGQHKGKTDQLELSSNDFHLNYEANFEIPCTMYINKHDQSIRAKIIKIVLNRYVDSKRSKVYGKLTFDLAKYFDPSKSENQYKDSMEMESGRSIPPVINFEFDIKQQGKIIDNVNVDANDISFIGEPQDKMKTNLDDWDVTEVYDPKQNETESTVDKVKSRKKKKDGHHHHHRPQSTNDIKTESKDIKSEKSPLTENNDKTTKINKEGEEQKSATDVTPVVASTAIVEKSNNEKGKNDHHKGNQHEDNSTTDGDKMHKEESKNIEEKNSNVKIEKDGEQHEKEHAKENDENINNQKVETTAKIDEHKEHKKKNKKVTDKNKKEENDTEKKDHQDKQNETGNEQKSTNQHEKNKQTSEMKEQIENDTKPKPKKENQKQIEDEKASKPIIVNGNEEIQSKGKMDQSKLEKTHNDKLNGEIANENNAQSKTELKPKNEESKKDEKQQPNSEKDSKPEEVKEVQQKEIVEETQPEVKQQVPNQMNDEESHHEEKVENSKQDGNVEETKPEEKQDLPIEISDEKVQHEEKAKSEESKQEKDDEILPDEKDVESKPIENVEETRMDEKQQVHIEADEVESQQQENEKNKDSKPVEKVGEKKLEEKQDLPIEIIDSEHEEKAKSEESKPEKIEPQIDTNDLDSKPVENAEKMSLEEKQQVPIEANEEETRPEEKVGSSKSVENIDETKTDEKQAAPIEVNDEESQHEEKGQESKLNEIDKDSKHEEIIEELKPDVHSEINEKDSKSEEKDEKNEQNENHDLHDDDNEKESKSGDKVDEAKPEEKQDTDVKAEESKSLLEQQTKPVENLEIAEESHKTISNEGVKQLASDKKDVPIASETDESSTSEYENYSNEEEEAEDYSDSSSQSSGKQGKKIIELFSYKWPESWPEAAKLDQKGRFDYPTCIFPIHSTVLHSKALEGTNNTDELIRTLLFEYCNDHRAFLASQSQPRVFIDFIFAYLIKKDIENHLFESDKAAGFLSKLGNQLQKSITAFLNPILKRFDVVINRFATGRFEIDPLLADFRKLMDTSREHFVFTDGFNNYLKRTLMDKIEYKMVTKIVSNPMRFMFSNIIAWNSFLSAFVTNERMELDFVREVVAVMMMTQNLSMEPTILDDLTKRVKPNQVCYIMKNFHPDVMMPKPIDYTEFASFYHIQEIDTTIKFDEPPLRDVEQGGNDLIPENWNKIKLDHKCAETFPFLKKYVA